MDIYIIPATAESFRCYWPDFYWYSLTGLGVFLFGLFGSFRLALSAASLWGVISFSISGFTFPVMAMHPTLQALSVLFPLRHYFLLYANLALNGYPLYLCLAFCSGITHIYAAAILCIEETAYNHVTLYIYSLKGQSWKNIHSDILYGKG